SCHLSYPVTREPVQVPLLLGGGATTDEAPRDAEEVALDADGVRVDVDQVSFLDHAGGDLGAPRVRVWTGADRVGGEVLSSFGQHSRCVDRKELALADARCQRCLERAEGIHDDPAVQ